MVPSRAEDVDREEQVTLAEPIPLPVHDGVGRFFDLADLRKGESVLDLGSGSGMDAFLAAHYVGPAGRVLGIDMTGDQLAKASRLAERLGYTNVEFRKGFLEELPVEQESVDCIISNGMINLCPGCIPGDPPRPPSERQARVGRHRDREAACGSRNLQLEPLGGLHRRCRTPGPTSRRSLRRVSSCCVWRRILSTGFLSRSARGASREYSVRSVSLLARPTA
jgi:arsenite methyltransferase